METALFSLKIAIFCHLDLSLFFLLPANYCQFYSAAAKSKLKASSCYFLTTHSIRLNEIGTRRITVSLNIFFLRYCSTQLRYYIVEEKSLEVQLKRHIYVAILAECV